MSYREHIDDLLPCGKFAISDARDEALDGLDVLAVEQFKRIRIRAEPAQRSPHAGEGPIGSYPCAIVNPSWESAKPLPTSAAIAASQQRK